MKKRCVAPAVVLMCIVILFPALYSNLLAATEDYAGAYTCTFSGAISGIAIVHVDASGGLEGVIWSREDQTVDYVAGGAGVDADGIFSFVSFCGLYVEGSITPEGVISGTWEYGYGQTGTFEGELDTGSPDAFAGSYSGTFSGDDSGTWSASISSDGLVTGELHSTANGSTAVHLGMVDSLGNVIMITENDISIKGSIDTSGRISGIWTDRTYSGTFTNQSTGDSGGGGGGGGGGCFISATRP